MWYIYNFDCDWYAYVVGMHNLQQKSGVQRQLHKLYLKCKRQKNVACWSCSAMNRRIAATKQNFLTRICVVDACELRYIHSCTCQHYYWLAVMVRSQNHFLTTNLVLRVVGYTRFSDKWGIKSKWDTTWSQLDDKAPRPLLLTLIDTNPSMDK